MGTEIRITYFVKKNSSHNYVATLNHPPTRNSEEHESRQGEPSQNITEVPNDLLFKILRAGDRLVALAPQLITNRSSNLAECFMSMRAKFDGGNSTIEFKRGPLNIDTKVQVCNGSWVLSGTLQLWKR